MTAKRTTQSQQNLGDSWSSDDTPMNPASSQSGDESVTPLPSTRSTRVASRASNRAVQYKRPTTKHKPTSAVRHSATSSRDRFNSSTRARRPPSSREDSEEDNRPPRATRPRRGRKATNEEDGYAQLLGSHVVMPALRYILNVIGDAFQTARPLFALAICLGVLVFGLQYSRNMFYSTVLAPVCRVPGSSILPFCSKASLSKYHREGPPPDFEELDKIQEIFAEMVEGNRDAYFTQHHLARVTNDLSTFKGAVKRSSLPSARKLDEELNGFTEAMVETIDALMTYNSHVGFVIHQVVTANEYTLLHLAELKDEEHAYQKSLPSTLWQLTPWALGPKARMMQIEDKLYDLYRYQIQKLEVQVDRLLAYALKVKDMLKNADKISDILATVAAEDEVTLTSSRKEVEKGLWFGIIGKGKHKLADYEKNIALINTLFEHRDVAVTAVTHTIHKLNQISAELRHLKEDMSAPKEEGYKPMNFHIDRVYNTIMRLADARDEDDKIAYNARQFDYLGLGPLDGQRDQQALPRPLSVRSRVKKPE